MPILPPFRRSSPPRPAVPPPAALPAALSLAVALLASGCAAVPAVDGPTIGVAEARATDIAEPVQVRWGGTIAEVRNTAEGTTVLEIVSRPLRTGGRPRIGDRTDGRFLAEVDAFLDPEIVIAGRDVTVIGSVAERREGVVGETPYSFPVVEVADYRYWQPERYQNHFPHRYSGSAFYGGPFYGGPFHGGFGQGWPHSSRHHRRGSGVSISGGVRF